MFGIIAVSLSILVILAGLAMLAKSKKEELGKLYTFSSYAAIIMGLGLFIGGNLGGMHRLGHAMKAHCSTHGSCGSSSSMHGGACASMSSCGHGGMNKACMQGGQCMHMGAMHHGGMKSCCKSKMGKCGKSHHGDMMHGEMHEKKIIKKEMEVDEDDDDDEEDDD